jgi:hypothetical protein
LIIYAYILETIFLLNFICRVFQHNRPHSRPSRQRKEERNLIRTRTAEGRSRGQKRGHDMGRPPKLKGAQAGRSTAAALRVLRLPHWHGGTAVGKSSIS